MNSIILNNAGWMIHLGGGVYSGDATKHRIFLYPHHPLMLHADRTHLYMAGKEDNNHMCGYKRLR